MASTRSVHRWSSTAQPTHPTGAAVGDRAQVQAALTGGQVMSEVQTRFSWPWSKRPPDQVEDRLGVRPGLCRDGHEPAR